ncbi:hypothetical protein CHU93_09395 [Sandarakinorhabdus cyanobacteriorum]|uniref:Uncharacterized protein n=1 Tax=Sandarakinorhabdus cyanobacteriorum TaxID=1981098 RepID=A0A255YIB6_9SPHN|nr:hypothetical protein [Sandarakinorhabdus cyanobacteriorum]OYQ28315.1 hypothetical protein CHU93_09395 [Sandarakinorhabdus cyanobacteriorum]
MATAATILRHALFGMAVFTSLLAMPAMAQNAFSPPREPADKTDVEAQPRRNGFFDPLEPMKATLSTSCGLSDVHEGLRVRAPQGWEFKPNSRYSVISANDGSAVKGIVRTPQQILVSVYCKRAEKPKPFGFVVLRVDYELRASDRLVAEWQRQAKRDRLLAAEKQKQRAYEIRFRQELIRVELMNIARTQSRITSIHRSLDANTKNFRESQKRYPKSPPLPEQVECIENQEKVSVVLGAVSEALGKVAKTPGAEFYAESLPLIGDLGYRYYCVWRTILTLSDEMKAVENSFRRIRTLQFEIMLREKGYI